ncbi:flavin reductase family protein [Clostridium frigoris]|uniref:Flavin reductase family protein n=1 Tax=Clostridium frigoris TaxID=205327 RepID=A0ABS6BNV5_9CLOT|nr:flavin reductase family protein [Clostridium frigoris]MBU3158603.1 flavin reductase family protein [Clostridium frigoris]
MEINFTDNLERGMKFLKTQGAFLTVKDGEKINTMTIGWGNVGYIWNRPIFTVMVRKSRYTIDFLENTNNFTVSIPLNENMKKALMVCGSKSGRDIDKFKECNLTLEKSKKVDTPIIGECELFYECKIVYKQEMDPKLLLKDIVKSSYEMGDYHTLYYGEIVETYKK